MVDTRVLPSGKVYRQMFDAQVQLSLALFDSRRKRVADEDDGLLSGDAADSASQQLNGTLNITTRNTFHSGGKRSEDQDDSEEVWGLPDTVVPEKKNSDIIDRLAEKRRKDHTEAVSQLQTDLSSISVRFEPLFGQTGTNILLRLSEHNDNIESLMQKIENISDLTAHSYEDMHEIWNKVSHESSLKRKWIKELDEIYSKYESERKTMISALLRNSTTKLEKISYLMPCDVHRLIDNEAMMINQALLANQRALAKLCLNLMEKHLQMDIFQRQRWEEKLQDWKRIKLNDAVSRFKEFMNSPHIKNPKSIQDTMSTLKSDQKTQSEKRIQTLEILRDMTPPGISKASVAEWYSALSVINKQIDCIHIAAMEKLHKNFENNWQVCLAEVDLFKTEVSTCGFTSDEIQNIVNVEILPLIGQCQSQTEIYLEKLDTAFERLAKTAAYDSKCLFKLMNGAAQLWEIHCAGMLNREQQLQNSLESLSQVHEQENQRKEAQLDMMLDKLRQESSEEALKACLEKTLNCLEEVKNGYMNIYKEEVETVEGYLSLVLQELQAYSHSVSQFFNVKEIYGKDSKDFCQLYPSLKLGKSMTTIKNERLKTELEVKHRGAQKPHFNRQGSSTFSPSSAMDDQDCKTLEFSISQTKETLTTAKGNVYNCFGFHTSHNEEQETDLKETELVLYPKALIVELLKDVRQTFFSHLEESFHITLNNTMTVVEAKKEKLKAELDLRLQLHQPRAARIEMDIHNVRAAELVLHQERMDRHCKGILDVLEDCRTEVQELQIQQNKLTEDFLMQIYNREKDFTIAASSEKINKLRTSLQTNLNKHISIIQTLQRDFRQKTEFRLEGLRDANVQIMRSFKLFSEGGSFTPQEIEVFQSHLEKMDKRIDSAEWAVIQDMEERETKCLEQAKDILRKFEEKFSFLAIDLKFFEKMQQIFTNTRVQIKGEALKSNMQKKAIDGMLTNLKEMTAEYDQPTPDKKIVTVVEITSLTTSLMEELQKRCQYLDCFLDSSMAVPRPQTPFQGAFAVAARPRSRIQEKTGSPDGDGLLHPSRIGVSFLDDAAVGVIKGLLKVGKAQDLKEANVDSIERRPSAARINSPFGSDWRSGKSPSQSGIEPLRRKSVESMTAQRRFSKPNRFDKKFLIFGSKPEEQLDSVPFKASITSILWKANDILLLVAEEFYKKKERRPITRPEQLQETFDQCAEEINKRLLIYQSQSHDYHNSCLQEFQLQLKAIEEFLSNVPEKLFSKLRDQYLEELTRNMTQIQQRFQMAQEQSEQKRREHSGQLRVRLSHPAYETELKQLVLAEEERQTEHRQAIQNKRQDIQACVLKNAEEFVTALARLAEALLFQFDNLITIHEVQVGYAEQKKAKITTLIRQTQTDLLLEDKSSTLIQKGSRTWSGICYFGSTDGRSFHKQSQETATITTAKTTLGHLKTIEKRDAVHEHYGQRVQEELFKAQRECDAQERQLQQWYDHWQSQLKTLASLTSE
ncbi:coiled-coil domain-containing protein 180 isoform X1 [Labeo rohita]|uniref:coiled-coil domain-containing protein 180 isoform X1 n=1 Tax=Labeo rohita TaxID=84645 RepID=UPI0021E34220|nr:coiled-coil domain-containing protein 180 isoform X1 [Labeo rohita]XP_050966694.1 coiled-coil domain-containing protein 180 isoform X1 [Labeo rohita]